MTPEPPQGRVTPWWVGPAVLAVLGVAVGAFLVARPSAETGFPAQVQVRGAAPLSAPVDPTRLPSRTAPAAPSHTSPGGPTALPAPGSPAEPSAGGGVAVAAGAAGSAPAEPAGHPAEREDHRAGPPLTPVGSPSAAVVSRQQPVLSGPGDESSESPSTGDGTDD